MLDVGEHADVTLAVDVDAERVLALPLAREEVAAIEDRPGVDADPVVRRSSERHDVLACEELSRSTPPAAGTSWKNGSW